MSKSIIKKGVKKTVPSLFRLIDRIEGELNDLRQTTAELSNKLDSLEHKLEKSDTRLDKLREASVKVEPYQALYGVKGIIDEPARDSASRCEIIFQDLNNDVHGIYVLDIGSSLGFVPFYMGDRGAFAEGWDNNEDNTRVAKLTQQVNGIQAVFRTKELNDATVKVIQPNQFDVVIILNVLHHMVRFQGIDNTKMIIKNLLNKVPVLYVELARKGEDKSLPWDKYQPENELDLFKGLDVKIEKLGEFPNHLSKKKRPLYKISHAHITVKNHKYLVNKTFFKSFKNTPTARHGIQRQFYLGEEHFIKSYIFEKNIRDNEQQMLNEINFFLQLKDKRIPNIPELLDFEVGSGSGTAVFKYIDGVIMDEAKLNTVEVVQVARDIAKILSELERNGYYHNDVRTWNIMISKTGTHLIDFGLVSNAENENNLVAYFWMINSGLSHTREPLKQFKTKLPPQKEFSKDPKLQTLYESMKNSKISCFEDVTKILK